MNKLAHLLILSLLILGCSTQKENKSIVGKWNLASLKVDKQVTPEEMLNGTADTPFLDIDYTKMSGYIFEFEQNGKFDQNYWEPVETGLEFMWEINSSDSLLRTYHIREGEKSDYITGHLSFSSTDEFILTTSHQSITFKRVI